jgi:hypothetical protein
MQTILRPRQVALATATLALAGTLVGISAQRPAVADAVASAPVSVAVCQATNFKGWALQRFFLGYENRQSAPADLIRFLVDFGRGDKPQIFTETGTFSSGARINHAINLATYSYQMAAAPPACAVVYVHFTDGSIWVEPRRQARQGS